MSEIRSRFVLRPTHEVYASIQRTQQWPKKGLRCISLNPKQRELETEKAFEVRARGVPRYLVAKNRRIKCEFEEIIDW